MTDHKGQVSPDHDHCLLYLVTYHDPCFSRVRSSQSGKVINGKVGLENAAQEATYLFVSASATAIMLTINYVIKLIYSNAWLITIACSGLRSFKKIA